ncbi:vacuolar sorting protein VPS33/slp1 [Nowakowskiella sp. JEL0078]|nr:vacuolar sorting protein VPS33/slp1 [Nowakowskiella sp. JEL0078]
MENIETEVTALQGMDYLSPNLWEIMFKQNEYSFVKRGKKRPASNYELHQYRPMLHYILEDIQSNSLNPHLFRYIKDYKDAEVATTGNGTIIQFKGNIRPLWGKRRRNALENGDLEDYRANGARIIVFVIGGVSFPEIRTADEFRKQNKRDILIGDFFK